MHGVLIHPLLVVKTMLTQGKSLVRCIDYESVFAQSTFIEVTQYPPHIIIHGFDQAVVSLDVVLVHFTGQFISRDIGIFLFNLLTHFFERWMKNNPVVAHDVGNRFRSAPFIIVKQSGWFRDGHILEEILIFGGRSIRFMGWLGMEQ